MIEASELSKSFGETRAVDQVSLSVKGGEVVGFLGLNGAGKTTTMRLLVGALTPDQGTARICGHDMAKARRAGQACLGYLPEAASGFSALTVREFLTFCGESRGFLTAELKAMIGKAAEAAQVAAALDKPMGALSKGWRQRAWFAQALLHDPPVLILDEPTDGLDPGQKDHARALIRQVAKDKAIILSTHILEEAEEICDRVVVIAAGRLVADQPLAELLDGKGRLSTAFRNLTATAGPVAS